MSIGNSGISLVPPNAFNRAGIQNVKDFGAVGDGSTDDTTAFANFTAAVGTNGTGYIPAGTYSLTSLPTFAATADYWFDPGAVLLLNGVPQQRLSYYHPAGESYNVLAETFASGSNTTTTGGMTSGSKNLTGIGSTSGWSIGMGISVVGAGASGALLVSQVVAISGSTFTLADAAGTTVSGATVSHDDTAAHQAGLDAANTAGGGEVLFMGTPVVSSPLTIYANTWLHGRSRSDKFMVSADFKPNGFTTNVTMVLICPNAGAKNVYVTDLTIDGSGSTVAGACGFIGNSTSGSTPTTAITFRNVAFDSLTGRAVYILQNCRVIMNNCKVINAGASGFRFVNEGANNNEAWLTNCIAESCAQHGFHIEGVSKGYIASCKSYNNTAGGANSNGIAVSDNCTIFGCETFGNANAGLYANGSNNSIVGCITHDNNLGCDLYNGSAQQSGNRVIGCQSYGNKSTVASNSPVKGFSGYNQTNLTIIGNVSYDNGDGTTAGVGLDYDQVTEATILGNRCYDDRATKYQEYGIHIRSSAGGSGNIRLADNDVRGNLTQNLLVDSGITHDASGNGGYNPVGLTSETLPASGTAYTNIGGVRQRIFLTGGTLSALAINGTATGITATPVNFELDPSETFTPTYSNAPTMTVFGL